MKRLIVTGIACPPEPWARLFGDPKNTRVIPIYEVLESSSSADPRMMSRYIMDQIEKEQPESIVCHDLGVPMTLISLMRLNRRGIALDTKVTLFNGAFRKYDVFKSTHPFRIQIMSPKAAVKEIESHGGAVDLRLKKHLSRIRAMYRLLILFGIAEKLGSAFGIEDLLGVKGKFDIKAPIQLIASKNDPFIPHAALEQIRRDFGIRRVIELEYGHYPYSFDAVKIRALVDQFESEEGTMSPTKKKRGSSIPRPPTRSPRRPAEQSGRLMV